MAMSPRKQEASSGIGKSVVRNATPGATKPKKMMRGGPVKMKDGGFPDLSGDGKVTQKDILMGKGVIKKPAKKMRGGPMKKAMGGVAKKSGVMKKMRGGPVKKMRGGPMKKMMGGGVAKKSGVMKKMRGGPVKKKK